MNSNYGLKTLNKICTVRWFACHNKQGSIIPWTETRNRGLPKSSSSLPWKLDIFSALLFNTNCNFTCIQFCIELLCFAALIHMMHLPEWCTCTWCQLDKYILTSNNPSALIGEYLRIFRATIIIKVLSNKWVQQEKWVFTLPHEF